MSAGAQTSAGGGRAAQRARRDRWIAGLSATAAHGLVLALLLSGPPLTPHVPEPESEPLVVTLVPPPPPPPPPPAPTPKPEPARAPAPGPKTPAPPKRVKAAQPPPPERLTREPKPTEVPARYVPPEPAPPEPAPEVAVSDAQLASAVTAESEAAGGGGGGDGYGGAGAGAGGRCDMVNRLQRALRGDARVRQAIAQAKRAPGFVGRPLVVWNGDWVRHGVEDGKGLASLRQAIAVEVAFAPKPCRAQPMHGLVMLSLNDGPGSTRVVLGAGAWRWSDLLSAR